MDDKIIKVVKNRLRYWEGKPISKDKLVALRQEIYEKTGSNKSAPFANVKKWIKAARKEMTAAKKKKTKTAKSKSAKKTTEAKKPASKKSTKKTASKTRDLEPSPVSVPESVQNSLDELKAEMEGTSAPEQVQEVAPKKPPMVLDKVYLQSMSFEMASMRQALDRIGRQLDKLERELSNHRQGGDE